MEERKSVKEFLSSLKDTTSVKIRGHEYDVSDKVMLFGPLTIEQFQESGRDLNNYTVTRTILFTGISKEYYTLLIDCCPSGR